MQGNVKIGEVPSIDDVAKLLGITKYHIYNQITEDNLTFKFRKVEYTIIDKLD